MRTFLSSPHFYTYIHQHRHTQTHRHIHTQTHTHTHTHKHTCAYTLHIHTYTDTCTCTYTRSTTNRDTGRSYRAPTQRRCMHRVRSCIRTHRPPRRSKRMSCAVENLSDICIWSLNIENILIKASEQIESRLLTGTEDHKNHERHFRQDRESCYVISLYGDWKSRETKLHKDTFRTTSHLEQPHGYNQLNSTAFIKQGAQPGQLLDSSVNTMTPNMEKKWYRTGRHVKKDTLLTDKGNNFIF